MSFATVGLANGFIMTPQVIEAVVILACTVFTGAAVYVTSVEYPTRLSVKLSS
jgi:hypothetical protein